MPSITGIIQSRIARRGPSAACRICQASTPSLASTTLKPQLVSMVLSTIRNTGLSSAMRIFTVVPARRLCLSASLFRRPLFIQGWQSIAFGHHPEKISAARGRLLRRSSSGSTRIARGIVVYRAGRRVPQGYPGPGGTKDARRGLVLSSRNSAQLPRVFYLTFVLQWRLCESDLAPVVRMAGKTILIVEDSPVSLKLTASVLRAEGYRVQLASSAEQALSSLRSLKPDLILVDLMLPGMNGLELASRIKQDSRLHDVKVLALTACGMEGDEERARDAGCDGYLTKT